MKVVLYNFTIEVIHSYLALKSYQQNEFRSFTERLIYASDTSIFVVILFYLNSI